MKKLFTVSLLVVLALTIVAAGPAYGAGGEINGVAGASLDAVTPEALTIEIRNANGVVTNVVKRSNPSTYAVRPYWIRFGGGGEWLDATVIVTISVVGLPEKTMTFQLHQDSPYAGWTLVPFAITDWGGVETVIGQGRITVLTSDGDASYVISKKFGVNPY